MTSDESIHLDDAHSCHDCITPRTGAALTETTAWALEHHGHENGVGLRVEFDGGTRSLPIYWAVAPDAKSDKTYADHQRVAEHAATILALECVRILTGFTGFERSHKGTRFDYYLIMLSDDTLIFNDTANLEVSGIFAGTKGNTVASRRNKKVSRLDATGGPGLIGKTYVCVVELSTPWAELVLS